MGLPVRPNGREGLMSQRRFQTDLGLYYARLRAVCGLSRCEAERWLRVNRERGDCWVFPDPDQPSGFRLLILSPSTIAGDDGGRLGRKGVRP